MSNNTTRSYHTQRFGDRRRMRCSSELVTKYRRNFKTPDSRLASQGWSRIGLRAAGCVRTLLRSVAERSSSGSMSLSRAGARRVPSTMQSFGHENVFSRWKRYLSRHQRWACRGQRRSGILSVANSDKKLQNVVTSSTAHRPSFGSRHACKSKLSKANAVV